ncbi:YdiU family protein [Aquimarina hainanensis]|uniref:Protein nucleotidyltransferase YdiU n=1 Tax=Aquimarina hainanensis TaxID=1578017 RepID=A0ABW5N3H5_9FLAO
MKLTHIHHFTQELPADPIMENTRRQVPHACFSYVTPKKTTAPSLIHASKETAALLGITSADIISDDFLQVFTGNSILPETNPYAMCYGGHQFGNWAGQLGDGRAINLTTIRHKNQSYSLQLKGAGETPYSRTADGLAVLRSSIREYLCSEAMHHLGISTTRALSLCLSGDKVLRDMLYDGNPAYEKGAIVCRVAPSFLRFGSYEIFASRQDTHTLQALVDYTIKHHFPSINPTAPDAYLQFFQQVCNTTLQMIIDWQRVGFVHGVMNTDNMSILGLTIDYGPYGWLEGYDPQWTPNTTDRQFKRYRYGNQPHIGLWNLLQLANALYPLIQDAKPLEAILNGYKDTFESTYLQMMKAKIGLFEKAPEDLQLIEHLEETLQLAETDMTIFFRNLSSLTKNHSLTSKEIIPQYIKEAIYNPDTLSPEVINSWTTWITSYLNRLQKEPLSDSERKKKMDAVNPKYVLRNYMAQLAIEAADKGDYSLIEEFYTLLKNPYKTQPDSQKWFAKRPEWARHKAGCSMLSCSS